MNGRQNISKNATPLKDWLGDMTESVLATFASDNYFPGTVGLEFKDFITFLNARKEVLRKALKNVLAVTSEQFTAGRTDWSE